MVLEAILDKLGIADSTSTLPGGDGRGFSLKEKVANLEKFFTDLTRACKFVFLKLLNFEISYAPNFLI